MLERVHRKGTLLHCWWEYTLVQPLQRTVWSFPKKTKNRTTMLFNNPTPGHISRENHNLKIHAPQYSLQPYLQWAGHGNNINVTIRGMDKEEVDHIYNGILLSHSKE